MLEEAGRHFLRQKLFSLHIQVPVNICGHLNIGVTHVFLYIFQRESVVQEQAGAAVPKLVKADMRQMVVLQEKRKMGRYIKDDDFFGVQNYTRTLMGPEGSLPVPDGAETAQMGYEFYPQALGHVLRTVHKSLPIPLVITENGVAVSDDARRVVFIEEALRGVKSCVDEGIPIKGYMYWSLMDNFEWQKGFSMTFGLIAVDRDTMERRPKESLAFLGSRKEKQ